MPARVRPYQPADRAAVLRIAADTAFFGEPVERFMEDRRLQADFFIAYYLDHEPQCAWVAVANDEVVGYLTGSTGARATERGKTATALKAAAGLVGFRYRVGPLTRRYALRAARAVLAGEYPKIDEHRFPAELHINLTADARGLGLGRALLEACLNQMTALGVPGIHLSTTSRNVAALRLYEKLGFEVLGRKRSTLWEPWLPGEEIDNLVLGKSLPAN
jgi:ribosomal protein S18 acetylase RimI-like enzyme